MLLKLDAQHQLSELASLSSEMRAVVKKSMGWLCFEFNHQYSVICPLLPVFCHRICYEVFTLVQLPHSTMANADLSLRS